MDTAAELRQHEVRVLTSSIMIRLRYILLAWSLMSEGHIYYTAYLQPECGVC